MADRQSADRDERSTSPGSARAGRAEELGVPRRAAAAAAAVAAIAFLLYRSTLLPGLDFGDTASFQLGVTSPIITPRDGYPLYFAITRLLHSLTPFDPAYVANLGSAIAAAAACGLLVLVGAELSGSAVAGMAAGLLFGGSYTFWSQSVIAEVYALHAMLMSLSMLLLLRWGRRPTTGRLALFFVVYALGFGNHLSMVLLAPGFTIFLLISAPEGWRSMFRPRVLALAALCAGAGALQYAWNLRALWVLPYPPHAITEAIPRFWFDVTKADWRATMVMGIPDSMLVDRAAMYAFDVRQQIGLIGVVLASAGLGFLYSRAWRHAVMITILWTVNVLFAFSYNVGDSHVFFLPSHLLLALLVAPGIVMAGTLVELPEAAAVLLLLYSGARIYRDYPALDRSRDTRPTDTLAALTARLDDHRAVLLTDLDWQPQNGLTLFAQQIQPRVAHAYMNDVTPYLPGLVADNRDISRDVIVTERAHRTVTDAYGPLFTVESDTSGPDPSLLSSVTRIPGASRYVFCLLKPAREFALSWEDLGQALAAAGDGRPVQIPDGDYVVIAGVRGRPPSLVVGANRPFERTIDLDGVAIDIRMESWLAFDTIRRMGYGHVIANRHHALIVERGVSFVALDRSGEPVETAYAANIFAPEPRYLIRLRSRP